MRPQSSCDVSRNEKIAASRKPNSVPAVAHELSPACSGATTTIPLAPPLLAGSSNLPGGFGRAVLSRLPIWSCSVRGFACHRPYGRRGALLPHLFTLTVLQQRFIFCDTFHRFTPSRCYLALRSVKPGLSSALQAIQRLLS